MKKIHLNLFYVTEIINTITNNSLKTLSVTIMTPKLAK